MRARPVSFLFRTPPFFFLLVILSFVGTATLCNANSVAPTLTYSPALTHIPLLQGQTATDVFTFTTGGSFQGNVTVAVSGLPTGVTGYWSQSPDNAHRQDGSVNPHACGNQRRGCELVPVYGHRVGKRSQHRDGVHRHGGASAGCASQGLDTFHLDAVDGYGQLQRRV